MHTYTCTWNVRILIKNRKLENIKNEMIRLNVHILGISEMGCPVAGEKYLGKHRIIYSDRGQEYERLVGIILDRQTAKTVKGFRTISD